MMTNPLDHEHSHDRDHDDDDQATDSTPTCWCPICAFIPPTPGATSYGDPRADEPGLLHITDTVLRCGWQVMHVSAGRTPPWTYTIGLWHACRHPELLVTGLPPEVAQQALNDLGQRARAGETFQSGDILLSPGDQHPLTFTDVGADWYAPLLGGVSSFYRIPPVPVLHLVWSDPAGRLPWEPGFDRRLEDQQPWTWHLFGARPDSVWSDTAALRGD